MTPSTGTGSVVTGGAGFIGSHLVEELLRTGGSPVTVIDDLSTGSEENLSGVAGDIELVVGDVCDPAVAAHCAPAATVYHLAVRNVRASIARPEENFRVNATGTLGVLEAMRTGAKGRFVYISSSEVYGTAGDGRFSEDTLPAPTTVYGAGKLAGELITNAYSRTYGMDTRVIRPFNNFGPRSHFEGDSGEVIPKFILRALAGRPLLIHGNGTQTRDFMFVEDTAHWLARLAGIDALCGETVNIGTGREVAIADLAAMILARTGSSSEVHHTEPRPGDVPRLQADVTRVSTLVDFQLPTDFEAGLECTIEFFSGRDVEALLAQEVERPWT